MSHEGNQASVCRNVCDGIAYYQFERLLEDGRVVHAMFTRLGGISKPPFATLNLSRTVGDEPPAVEENHRRALGTLGLSTSETVSCYQVHGRNVGLVSRGHCGTVQPATDALATTTLDVWLLLRFADCAPVLLFDPGVPAIGLAHAGWRGIVGGVIPNLVRAMVSHFGCDPRRMWAGIGPTIGPCCYEVDEQTAQLISASCPLAASEVIQQLNGHFHANLPMAAHAQLKEAGVGQVEDAGLCTACHVDEFFSHRAEHGQTGRFGIVIGLRG